MKANAFSNSRNKWKGWSHMKYSVVFYFEWKISLFTILNLAIALLKCCLPFKILNFVLQTWFMAARLQLQMLSSRTISSSEKPLEQQQHCVGGQQQRWQRELPMDWVLLWKTYIGQPYAAKAKCMKCTVFNKTLNRKKLTFRTRSCLDWFLI